MIWVVSGLVVWMAVGGLSYWWFEIEYYNRRPWARARKGCGLIAFTDRQLKWLYALWPLTVVLAVVIILLAWLFSLYGWITELVAKFKEK